MKRHLNLLLLGLLLPLFAIGQKYSNEFLAIGAGARAQGMGNAASASTMDAYSPYWNPAGMAGVDSDLQLAFMHAEWFAGVGNYDYLSVLYPLHNAETGTKRAVGFSMVRFGIDDIPNTLSLYEDDGTVNYANIVPFSAVDYAFLLSYAQSLNVGDNSKLYVGGNAKIIYRKIGPFAKATGFGFDLSAQYHLGKHWSFGFSGKDITSTFNAWSFSFTDDEKETLALTGNDIPISSLEITKPWFVLGTAYQHRFKKLGILAEVDLITTTDGKRNTLLSGNTLSMDPAIGLELDYNQVIFLRTGLNNFQKETDIFLEERTTMKPTFGIGLKLYAVKLDYAFTDMTDTSQKTYSHIVSLLVDMDFDFFNKKKK